MMANDRAELKHNGMQKLQNFINSSIIDNDGENNCIVINDLTSLRKYYEVDSFKYAYFNYINSKIQEGNVLTDPDNNIHCLKCNNVLYLDCDFYFSTSVKRKDYVDKVKGLSMRYKNYWIDCLKNKGIIKSNDIYSFEFIPNEFGNGKGGFHDFLYLKCDLTRDVKMELYEDVKRKVLVDKVMVGMLKDIVALGKGDNIESIYDKLFDSGTVKNNMILMPFAQKNKDSRQYVMVETDFDSSIHDWFVNGAVHRSVAEIGDEITGGGDLSELMQDKSLKKRIMKKVSFTPVEDASTKGAQKCAPMKKSNRDGENDKNIDELLDLVEEDGEQVNHALTASIIDDLLNTNAQNEFSKFANLGETGRIIANFMLSLVYLSPGHIFWRKLADNEERLKYIITPLIQFIYVNYVIEKQGKEPDNSNDKFVHSLTRIMLPLLRMTVTDSNEGTKRATYESCFQHIKSYYNKYTETKNIMTPEMLAFWAEYVQMDAKMRKNLTFEQRGVYGKIKKRFARLYSKWCTFVTKIVLAGITDEIKPFKERMDLKLNNEYFNKNGSSNLFNPELIDPRKNVTFDDVFVDQPSVNKSAVIEDSFYTKTLRLWCVMFLFVEVYNSSSLKEAIRSILTAFTKYFIWYNGSLSGNNKIYIYNIRQTKFLERYPYNQWLLDTQEGASLKSWLHSLYLQFIKPELLRVNSEVGTAPLFTQLERAELINKCDTLRSTIKPLADMSTDMEKMYKNVLETFSQEHYDPPRELDPVSSNFLPMRNGLLEFKNDGGVEMHYDNHSRFMTTYTNIVWDDTYDYDCKEFKSISTMWEQIFPVKEERDYALKLYASTLVGSILKDMLVIQYGTGGDGKTISNNAMLGLLGSDGVVSHVDLFENGKRVYVENPNGLANTMKTETILVSSKNSHDSGGIVQLKNKRFCTVQEPDPNLSGGKLNCARIKEILSGTTITAREIFQKAESFTVNALLTLQTNILLAYTEDTDAIRRRIALILYRSKFCTAISGDKFDTLEYKFKADPQLSSNLVENPMYWQALFYYLLPYAQELKKDGIKALSDIERPISIKQATNESFSQSNGLVGWLNKNITESPGNVLCVNDLTEHIIKTHNDEKARTGGILVATKTRDKVVEVYGQLMGTFMGRIYKLRDEFYNRRKTAIREDFEIVNTNEDGELISNNTLIGKYFNRYAVNSMEMADLISKEDLYIVGYALRT